MSWYKKKVDSTKKDKLKVEISVILEKYKPVILKKLEEFNNMDGLKTIKYIRTWTLLREIERTHLIKKLLILWLSGIFNFILKSVNKEIALETLDEKTLTLVIEDTQLNYLKKSCLFRDLNNEVKKAFVKAGILFEPVSIADYLQKPQALEQKGHRRRLQTRLLKRLGTLSSAAKLPSVLITIFTFLSAIMGIIARLLFQAINNLTSFVALTSVAIHFVTGVLKAWGVFSDWIDAIAHQIRQEAPSSQMKASKVVDGWLLYFEQETEKQFDMIHPRKFRKFAVAACGTALILGLATYMLIYQDKSVASASFAFDKSRGEITPNTPVPAQIDRNKIIRVFRNQRILSVLTETGSDNYEASFSKELFGGTIPQTTVEIHVTYDYAVGFDVNLGQITESLVKVDGSSVQVYIPTPKMTEVQVSNDRVEVEKGFFASGDNPREEIEKFDSGDDSYIDILKKHTEEKLTNNETLKNRAKLEALDRVRTLVVDSIEDSNAKVQVLYSN